MDEMDTDVAGDRQNASDLGIFTLSAPATQPFSSVLVDTYAGASSEEAAWNLLALARQLVDQGKPSLALQAVEAILQNGSILVLAEQAEKKVMPLSEGRIDSRCIIIYGYVLVAIRSGRGEQAVLETLQRARELYRSRVQASASVDELASLFAECAIAEARPMSSSQPFPTPDACGLPTPLDSDETSILSMTGRKQIMLDAFADGSNFVCLQCGGLVSNQRRDEHLAYWCG